MLRFLIALPGLAVLVAFALSNQTRVPIGMWPFETTVEMPLAVAVLVVAALFFMFGALLVWLPALAARTRARRAEQRLARLQAELEGKARDRPRAVATVRS